MIDPHRLSAAYEHVRRELLDERVEAGHWVGELATSALSTATAASALALVALSRAEGDLPGKTHSAGSLLGMAEGGIAWLAAHQNADGGWGDTDRSHSNIATTMLAVAAFHLCGSAAPHADRLAKAEDYITSRGGIEGLRKRYGVDKTFAVPILTNCALAGLVPWHQVSPLPFELAALPQSWFRFLGLPVVSYAIPALVAVGQARFAHRPPLNPIANFLRRIAVGPSMKVLQRMQPASGGFLEAVPLTSFVVMCLAGSGRADHLVARNGVEFLSHSVRPDGSWPIDTNLATWNTTLAMQALAAGGQDVAELDCLEWLLRCQVREVHPFTGAAPGGWGWTDLSGSVPDADDTSGALLALAAWHRSPKCGQADRARILEACRMGVGWLLELQNRDGGFPTFCRGWGKLPFDRSGSDLTAHALRALHAWRQEIEPRRASDAIERGFHYLARQQRADGSFAPLWFGNQHHPQEENPVYGTAKVLAAHRDLGRTDASQYRKALAWLAARQNADGGWGSAADRCGPSSVEETALAVEALVAAEPAAGEKADPRLQTAVAKGLDWLVGAVEQNRHRKCSPIGFYFAKLWYYERLYPLTFTASALGHAARRCPHPRSERRPHDTPDRTDEHALRG
jgi:squalene-hopene/tetraprenyl-beta-curcumene cyclase